MNHLAEREFPARGHAENSMTDDEIVANFQRLADGLLDAAAQRRIVEM